MINDVIISKPFKYIIYVQIFLLLVLICDSILIVRYTRVHDEIYKNDRRDFISSISITVLVHLITILLYLQHHYDPRHVNISLIKFLSIFYTMNIYVLNLVLSYAIELMSKTEILYYIISFSVLIHIVNMFSMITFLFTVLKSTKYE